MISAVVVTHNSAGLLPELFASLPGAMEGLDPWSVTIVDNGSTDGTLEAVAALAPHALVVDLGENAGYAAGVNAGMRGSIGARAHLILNPDVRLEPGTVARLLAALDTPGIGIAVPRLVDEHGVLCRSLRREPTILRALGESLLGGERAGRIGLFGEVVVDPASYSRPDEWDWASGAAMLISSECSLAAGPWDESFFLYSEETDFCLRARDAGFRTRLVPEARGVHIGGALHASDDLWSLLAMNRVRLYRSRHAPVATWAFWAGVALGEGLRAVGGRRRSRGALRTLIAERAQLIRGPA